ncbi:Phage tail sheath protein [Albimonas donghaensis]|uniref:Phage tail sheath protein n=1 Tax=Albimonas donghaensis TaxID=356660 RepID=A0A1H2U412_9RHOB|nr:hypothetical protein [Albimonas donghaensis]SDW50896.1 Phage tail sheath protein [Albimonas donghaensis]
MRPLPPFPSGRLPGVYVETAAIPPADALPRMDIAGFVGFAASGPLSVPVAVEDPGRFREIFGPDLALARDETRGETRTSLLGGAVESFFANGGRRAWVLRVADAERIATLAFPAPGMETANGAGVTIPARAPGMWPSALACGTRLTRTRLVATGPLARVPLPNGLVDWALTVAPGPVPPVPGDLLELGFRPDGQPGLVALAEVTAAAPGPGGVALSGRVLRFRRRAPEDPGTLGVENPGLAPIPTSQAALAAGLPAPPDTVNRLRFDLIAWRGEGVAARLEGLAFSPLHPRFWGALPDDARLFAPLDGAPRPSLAPGRAALIAEATAPRFPFAAAPDAGLTLPWGMATAPGRASANGPEIPAGPPLDLDGLAVFDDRLFLDPDLARADAAVLAEAMEAKRSASLALPGTSAETPPTGLHALSAAPEVSMVAIPDAAHRAWTLEPAAEPAPLIAPLLAPPAETPDQWGRHALSWSPAPGATRYRLERAADADFAAPTVTLTEDPEAALALDPDCPTGFAFRVRAERAGEVGPWSNTRLAQLPPDAFAACATPETPDTLILAEAAPGSPPRPGLAWSREADAPRPGETTDLQSSATPTFEAPEDEALPAPDIDMDWTPPQPLTAGRWFRVRLTRDGAHGPWSNAVRLAPETRADFAMVPVDAHAPGPLIAIHRALIRFCAARADAVALLSLPRHAQAEAAEAHLAALLPLTAPGDPAGDPAGARRVPALSHAEEGALSYAALFHPWIGVATPERQGFLPPDGAAAGLLARRAIAEGAWISAANQPIAGGVALSPRLPRPDAARLIDLQLNPLVAEPGGFVILNADTLSRTEELRPLPVRRLMILLRRLALREAQTYVFEPNSDDFRALVRRRFERLLSLIHQRGGLKGATPAAAFRVETGASVNSATAIDQGRFLVELRVAPSRPFRHLTVLLLQTGPQQVQVREA